jgi:hypothetical protein
MSLIQLKTVVRPIADRSAISSIVSPFSCLSWRAFSRKYDG